MAINIDPGTWGDKGVLWYLTPKGEEVITITDREHERIINVLRNIRDLTEEQFEKVIENIRR